MRDVKSAAVVLFATLLVFGCSDSSGPRDTSVGPEGKPSIVLIVADDMRAADLAYMPKTRSLLADEGIEYANAFVTTPVCCPSRASILTGTYAHNHGVQSNKGGFQTFSGRGEETRTVASRLGASYKTALVGKYLNGYDPDDASHVPPGWDEWYAKLGTHTPYYGYSLSENGKAVKYGSEPQDYMTDVEAGKVEGFVRENEGGSEPLFVYAAPTTPHKPYTVAERHRGMFRDATAARPPSFDEKDVTDKPGFVRSLPRLGNGDEAAMDERHAVTLRMLQSLDDMVGGVVSALEATGRLDNTYVVFTSDNGMHFGEHRIQDGKGTAYEESIRVPLLIRGPGIPAGRTTDQMALNIDLAPTFAELAGVDAPGADGRSLVPTFAEDAPEWRTAFLEESWGGQQVPTHRAIRTAADKLVYYPGSGERELYDLESDPHETENVAKQNPGRVDELSERLDALKGCTGESCRAAENP